MTTTKSFTELLKNDRFEYLIEELEWGSSDPSLEQSWKDELLKEFGWVYNE